MRLSSETLVALNTPPGRFVARCETLPATFGLMETTSKVWGTTRGCAKLSAAVVKIRAKVQRTTNYRLRAAGVQFPEGFTTESITIISIGPLVDSTFSPSCSCSAVNTDAPAFASSAVHATTKSY